MSHNATTLAIIIDPTTDYVIIGGNFDYFLDGQGQPVNRFGVAGFDSGLTMLSWQENVTDPGGSGFTEEVRALSIHAGPVGTGPGLWIGGHYTAGSPLTDPWGKDIGFYALP